MNNLSIKEIKDDFLKSKIGILGIAILFLLIIISIITIVIIPIETFKQWNNPANWISNPKIAAPSWINFFLFEKIPEHLILDHPNSETLTTNQVTTVIHQFRINYQYDDFPNDFIYDFSAKYSGKPLLKIFVIRPDDYKIEIFSTSLPFVESSSIHQEKIFSTDQIIKKNLFLQSNNFTFPLVDFSSENIIFSQAEKHEPLKGDYTFLIKFYGVESDMELVDSRFIVGGKVFGIMGTDELRRDLTIGLLWGTPLALFIGLVVAIASVIIGLIYGTYAGFLGKKTDESMMRFNDVIYALPALPFLIILSVTISNSIFVMIGFLMIFGWVGIAKVSRSMTLQIKSRGFVEAAEMMGQRKSKIVLKHILPQMLPYAFASIAISVPAAITTEAGLSFLGLGDPSFPTWGQILHDANTFGASSRGLWWWIIPPGAMIAITGLSFVFIGNSLDVIVNPKLRMRPN